MTTTQSTLQYSFCHSHKHLWVHWHADGEDWDGTADLLVGGRQAYLNHSLYYCCSSSVVTVSSCFLSTITLLLLIVQPFFHIPLLWLAAYATVLFSFKAGGEFMSIYSYSLWKNTSNTHKLKVSVYRVTQCMQVTSRILTSTPPLSFLNTQSASCQQTVTVSGWSHVSPLGWNNSPFTQSVQDRNVDPSYRPILCITGTDMACGCLYAGSGDRQRAGSMSV